MYSVYIISFYGFIVVFGFLGFAKLESLILGVARVAREIIQKEMLLFFTDIPE
jgi:hypothetical protein